MSRVCSCDRLVCRFSVNVSCLCHTDWQCTQCSVQRQLWLCMTCGHIGCSRYVPPFQHFHLVSFLTSSLSIPHQLSLTHGVTYARKRYTHRHQEDIHGNNIGGNSHAVLHASTTGHAVVVKLGTITAEGNAGMTRAVCCMYCVCVCGRVLRSHVHTPLLVDLHILVPCRYVLL